jgi:hypothetical protein
MPSNPSKGDSNKDNEEWISIGGKKVKIDPDEDKESLTRDVMPSLRGEKEKNTKEAQKVYKRRFDLIKSRFSPRDQVVFAEYNKSGVIAGFNGDKVNVMSEGRIYPVAKNDCFKKSELLNDRHWDTLTNVDRAELLKSCNLPTYYHKQNWGNLSPDIRGALLKNVSPAGTTTDTTGVHNPVYNPVNEEKSVSDTVKDEISRQHKSKNHEESESATDKKQYS